MGHWQSCLHGYGMKMHVLYVRCMAHNMHVEYVDHCLKMADGP